MTAAKAVELLTERYPDVTAASPAAMRAQDTCILWRDIPTHAEKVFLVPAGPEVSARLIPTKCGRQLAGTHFTARRTAKLCESLCRDCQAAAETTEPDAAVTVAEADGETQTWLYLPKEPDKVMLQKVRTLSFPMR